MEPVAADPVLVAPGRGHGVGVGVARAAWVERGVEDGDVRHAGEGLDGDPDALEVSRVVQRRQRVRASSMAAKTSSVTRTGSVNRSPPCTTRCPTASRPRRRDRGRAPGRPSAPSARASRWRRNGTALSCALAAEPRGVPRSEPLADPLDAALGERGPVVVSTSWYFSDDEPALTTRTARACGAVTTSPRLDRGDRHGVDDVLDQCAAGQVVDRPAEALEHRPDRHGAGAALDRLVGVVAGVEVREDEDRGAPGDGGVLAAWRRATAMSTAASYWIGPSTGSSGARVRTSSVAA